MNKHIILGLCIRELIRSALGKNDDELVGIQETTDMMMPFWGARLQFSPEIVTHIPSTVKKPRKKIHSDQYSRWWNIPKYTKKKKKVKKSRHKKRWEEGCVQILGVIFYLELIWSWLHWLKHFLPKQSFYTHYIYTSCKCLLPLRNEKFELNFFF